MTMHDVIWAMKDRGNGDYGTWDTNGADDLGRDTPYIRADIADELARALDVATVWLQYHGGYDTQGMQAALASYHAATEGK